MTARPDVSVIIPHYNDPRRLALCLDALDRQDFDRARFEIIVADNASPVGMAAVEHAVAGRARIVLQTEPGAGPARNAGVSAADGRLLAFTDCDCVPDPQWLSAGVAALAQADLIGGAMRVLVRNEQDMSGAEAFERVFAFNNRTYVEQKQFTVTANLFTTRTVFDTVGGFRVGVSEDKDWCHRASDMGYRIAYASDAIVGHPARGDYTQLLGKWRRIQAETYMLVKPGMAGNLYWLARTWAVLPSIIVHGARIITSGNICGARHRARALATLVRIRMWRFADGHRLLLTRVRGA